MLRSRAAASGVKTQTNSHITKPLIPPTPYLWKTAHTNTTVSDITPHRSSQASPLTYSAGPSKGHSWTILTIRGGATQQQFVWGRRKHQ